MARGYVLLGMVRMNGTDPDCSKTPIRAALEDTIVVFVYSFLAAIAALITVDGISAEALLLPLVLAGIQGMITYSRKRNIELPSRKEDGE